MGGEEGDSVPGRPQAVSLCAPQPKLPSGVLSGLREPLLCLGPSGLELAMASLRLAHVLPLLLVAFRHPAYTSVNSLSLSSPQ